MGAVDVVGAAVVVGEVDVVGAVVVVLVPAWPQSSGSSPLGK